MKTLKSYYFFLIFAMIFTASCSPVYVPNIANIPMHNNAGEMQLALYGGASGGDFQGSYAITDNVGLMANFNRVTVQTNDVETMRRWFAEGGLGYTARLGSFTRLEGYGGMGFGRYKGERHNNLLFPSEPANFTRMFFQPSIGASSDYFDGAFTMRTVFVTVMQPGYRQSGLFIEPVVTAKAGYRFVKGVMQFGLAVPVNDNNFNFTFSPFIFSMGMQITLFRDWDD